MMTEFDRGYAAGLAAMRDIFLRTGHTLVEMGPLSYDRETDQVAVNGKVAHFPASHRRVIELLLTGRVVTIDRAIPVLWPLGADDIEPDRLLKVHVCHIRRRLQALGAPRDAILTQWGVGYRLNPDAVWRPC